MMRCQRDETQPLINNVFKIVKNEGAEQVVSTCSVKHEYVELEENINIESVIKEGPGSVND